MVDCTDALLKAFPGMDKSNIETILSEVTQIRRRKSLSLAGKQEEYKKLKDAGKAFAALRLKNQINDQIKISKIIDNALNNKRFPNVEEALLNIFESIEANEVSVDALRNTNNEILQSNLVTGLRQAKLEEAAASGIYDRRVAKAMFDNVEYTGDGADIVNGLAKVFKASNEAMRVMLNDAGASIFRRADFIHSQFHHGDKIKKAGVDKWIADIKTKLDIEKSFSHLKDAQGDISEKSILEELGKKWKKLTESYDAMQGFSVEESVDKIISGNRIVDRMNKSRSLHFKDGEGFYDYNQKYGKDGNLVDTLNSSYNKAAKNAAMIEVLGTSPQKNLKKVIKVVVAQTQTPKPLASAISKKVISAFDVANGSGEYGIANKRAFIGRTARTIETLSLLGRAVFSAGMDIVPTMMHTKVSTGENLMVAGFRSIGEFMTNISPAQRKIAAKEMMLVSEAFTNQLKESLIGSSYSPGRGSRMVDALFTISGLNFVTDVARKANGRLAITDLTNIVKSGKHTLEQKNTIARFGLTPEDLASLDKVGDINPAALRDTSAKDLGLTEEGKRGLIKKVHLMINQRVSKGSPLPDARTRRRLGFNNPTGTTKGEVWRFFAQFKSSIMKITQDTEFMMRASSEDGGIANQKSIANLAQFMILATAVGGMRNLAVSAIGNPNEFDFEESVSSHEFWAGAFVTGGGAAIAGDAIAPLFMGRSAVSTDAAIGRFFVGPVGQSLIEGTTELRDLAVDGFDESTAKYMVGKVPFQNMWFLMHVNKKVAEILGNAL